MSVIKIVRMMGGSFRNFYVTNVIFSLLFMSFQESVFALLSRQIAKAI